MDIYYDALIQSAKDGELDSIVCADVCAFIHDMMYDATRRLFPQPWVREYIQTRGIRNAARRESRSHSPDIARQNRRVVRAAALLEKAKKEAR